MNPTRSLLERHAPFRELGQASLDRLAQSAREKAFDAGEVLFHELTEGDEIYLVVDGSIRMSVELASAYHVVEAIEGGPGDLVGEGRFIADGPRPATVTALSRVTVLTWNVDDWKAIAEADPAAGYRLAVQAGRVLFERVQELKAHLLDDMALGLE